jgi:hypothetical protein
MNRRKAVSTLFKGFGLIGAFAMGIKLRRETSAETLSALNAAARRAGESAQHVTISLEIFDRHVEQAAVRIYQQNGKFRQAIKRDLL